ncbi:DNA-processing protein DprA [Olivibacter ginsenosidimutans]|uniref:DNA-processing protein DprA n=1 Tax=Olivibacter ginsenosidimutans TaxID=1176537 RepID=A0ABP9CCT7_9SPHI
MTLIYQLALTRVKGIGQALAKQLLITFGSAEEVFRAPKKQLLKIPGIGATLAANLMDRNVLAEAERELVFLEKHHIQPLFWESEHYPAKLKECIDAPVLLYYKGNADLQCKRIISVVGTRNATAYGKRICDEFIASLKHSGALIVSGLAYGIDSYVHQACVEQGIDTVGVLGHGLDRIYPAANRGLAREMLHHGGLLTEYPSGTNPDRQNFPSRNRIIAGLADVTVVVEAAMKGGALITAELANTYNRDVCAFPGDIYKNFSGGCNYLIKTHRAHLIQSAKDLAYLMDWDFNIPKEQEQPSAGNVPENPVEKMVYEAIKQKGSIGVDELANGTQLLPSKLAMILLALEMSGLLVALPGKIYQIA